MILRIQHKELTIDLDLRERIILYLAQDLPLPESKYDVKALPRTILHMALALKIDRSSLYDLVGSMVEEGAVTYHPLGLRLKARGSYANVLVLTPEGQLLADAIRRQAK